MNKTPYNLDVTIEKARNQFAASDPQIISHKSGVAFDNAKKEFLLSFLDETYAISHPEGLITRQGKEGEVNIIFQILYLHYLCSSSGLPLKDEWISFKELPGGQIYITPFQNRAVKPFIKVFGKQPDSLTKAAKKLGGTPGTYGDMSYILPVFPRVPFMFVLWTGDEEFPASGTILFDASAGSYLPTEDFAMLSGLLVSKIKAASK